MATQSTNSWINNDGLYIKYGTDAAAVGHAGSFKTWGDQHYIEIELYDLTKLTTSAGGYIVDDTVFWPEGAYYTGAEILTRVAATSGTSSATLNVGLIQTDRATVMDSGTGFISAMALSAINAVAKDFKIDGTTNSGSGGAYLGTIAKATGSATNVGYICASAGTEVFTAGKVLIRLYYSFNLTS